MKTKLTTVYDTHVLRYQSDLSVSKIFTNIYHLLSGPDWKIPIMASSMNSPFDLYQKGSNNQYETLETEIDRCSGKSVYYGNYLIRIMK